MIDEASALIDAIRANDHKAMKQIFKDGVDVHQPNYYDELSGLVAAAEGDAKTLRILVDFDPSIANSNDDNSGVTPLMLASDDTKIEILVNGGADVNASLNDGRTPLMFAAQKGLFRGVKLLVKAGADIYAKTKDFKTALTFAVEEEHHEVEAFLRDLGVPDGKIGPSEQLILAAKDGDLAKVKESLLNGANPNAADYQGNTALIFAAGFHHLEILKLLLGQKGINIDQRNDDSMTSLLNACNASNYEGFEAMLAAGADMTVEDSDGNTALHWAAMRGALTIVTRLLQLGIDANAQNKRSWTSLHWAVEASQLSTIEALLKNPKTDKNRKDKRGVTPLQLAKQKVYLPNIWEPETANGIHPVVKLLLAYDAK